MVDKSDVVTHLLHRAHIVGGENDSVTFVAQFQDFLFQQLGIHRVEARKGLIENQKLRLVEHGNDKLHLLLHAFRQLFKFLIPPGIDVKLVKPLPQPFCSGAAIQPFEASKIDGLFAHLHFFVKTSLLRQITDTSHIGIGHLSITEHHDTLIGHRDTIDDSDKSGFTCSIRAKQSKHSSGLHGDAHSIESCMGGEAFHHSSCFQNLIHKYSCFVFSFYKDK